MNPVYIKSYYFNQHSCGANSNCNRQQICTYLPDLTVAIVFYLKKLKQCLKHRIRSFL